MPFDSRAAALLGAVIVPAIWVGAIAGVSFISAPLRFTAPEITLPAAIDVGRITFHVFNRIELVLALVSLVLVFLAPAGRIARGLCLIVCAILALQTLWVLPALEARSLAFVAGEPLPPSIHHSLFGIAEIAKVLLLLIMSGFAFRAGRLS